MILVLKIKFQMIECFIVVSIITRVIIIDIYMCIYYINFGFRFFDVAPFVHRFQPIVQLSLLGRTYRYHLSSNMCAHNLYASFYAAGHGI